MLNMFNGTNLTPYSDHQVGSGLYPSKQVGQKGRESSDTSMSTCDEVGHIPGHRKINKTLALLLLTGGRSASADPEGGGGVQTSPRNSQKYSFFSNTGPDPLKIVKLPSQLSVFGQYRHVSETPFRRFALGPKRAR